MVKKEQEEGDGEGKERRMRRRGKREEGEEEVFVGVKRGTGPTLPESSVTSHLKYETRLLY